MWFQELGEFYERNVVEEGYRGLSVDQTPQIKGMQAPTLAKPSLSYRNNKMGTAEPTMAAASGAGNVQFGNPYEQEEEVTGSIEKQAVLNFINELESTLDDANNNDRVALMVLGELKNKIV